MHSEQERKRKRLNVHNIARESVHTHTLCTEQERAACERATFLFQSASGDSAKDLLLAHW